MDFFRFSFALLVLHFLHSEANGNEQTGTKCSYDEHLLKKMIRVEVQMEEWDKHLKKFEKTVLSVLEHRKEEMENMTKEFKKIKELSDEYGELQDAQNEKLDELSSEQSKIRDVIRNKTLERRGTPIVAFNAYISSNVVNTVNQILIFPNVIFNAGDGYDATFGYFAAPVSGLYQFFVHICSQRRTYAYYAIVHNESITARSTMYESYVGACGSFGAVFDMLAGEKVYVKCTAKSHLKANVVRWPSFIGVLLHMKNS